VGALGVVSLITGLSGRDVGFALLGVEWGSLLASGLFRLLLTAAGLALIALAVLARSRPQRGVKVSGTGLVAPPADTGPRAALVERRQDSKTTEGGTVTVWEETRRGQDVNVTPKTVRAEAAVPDPPAGAYSQEPLGEWITSPYPPVSAATAVHRQHGEGVQLGLRNLHHVADGASFMFIVCRVTPPNGIPFEADRSLMLSVSKMLTGRPPPSVVFLYPFEDLDLPLVDGPYEVEWQARTHLSAPARQVIVGGDRFDISDEQLLIDVENTK
jgi:hypothetical protein